jgi:molecular chaperone DnaK
LHADFLPHQVAGFEEEHGIDLTRDHLALQRLHEAAETAKVTLTTTATSTISFLISDEL